MDQCSDAVSVKLLAIIHAQHLPRHCTSRAGCQRWSAWASWRGWVTMSRSGQLCRRAIWARRSTASAQDECRPSPVVRAQMAPLLSRRQPEPPFPVLLLPHGQACLWTRSRSRPSLRRPKIACYAHPGRIGAAIAGTVGDHQRGIVIERTPGLLTAAIRPCWLIRRPGHRPKKSCTVARSPAP
jgi:hypothetical protein